MSTQWTLTTGSPDETRELGQALAPFLRRGDIISLGGDLGAGKTVFVQGLAAGLGVSGPVTSSTFTILKQYRLADGGPRREGGGARRSASEGVGGQGPAAPLILNHFDLYRVETGPELFDLGWQEYLFGPAVSVVEWGENAGGALPPDCLIVRLAYSNGPSKRKVTVDAPGGHWQDVVAGWLGRQATRVSRG